MFDFSPIFCELFRDLPPPWPAPPPAFACHIHADTANEPIETVYWTLDCILDAGRLFRLASWVRSAGAAHRAPPAGAATADGLAISRLMCALSAAGVARAPFGSLRDAPQAEVRKYAARFKSGPLCKNLRVLPPGKWPAVAEVPICCRGPLPATLAAALSKHKLEASWESIDNLPYAAQQEMLEPIEHEVFAGYDGPLTDSTLYYMVKVGHDAGILTREELGGCAPMPRVLIGGAPEAAAIIRGNQHSNRKGRAKVLQHVAKMRFRHQVGLEVDAMRDEALDRLGGIHGQAGFALREFAAYIKSM